MTYCNVREVKQYLDPNDSNSDKDNLISDLILAAQSFIEAYCNRIFTQAAVIEYHYGGSDRIFLKRYPVASSPAVQIWDSWDRTYPSSDLIDTDDYYVDTENGIIQFDYPVGGSPAAVKISYTGGYASASFPAAIKQACIELVARKIKEGTGGSLGAPTRTIPEGGSVQFAIDDILPQTKAVLNSFRKMACD